MNNIDKLLLFVPAIITVATAISAYVSARRDQGTSRRIELEEENANLREQLEKCQENLDRKRDENIRLMRKLLSEGDQEKGK